MYTGDYVVKIWLFHQSKLNLTRLENLLSTMSSSQCMYSYEPLQLTLSLNSTLCSSCYLDVKINTYSPHTPLALAIPLPLRRSFTQNTLRELHSVQSTRRSHNLLSLIFWGLNTSTLYSGSLYPTELDAHWCISLKNWSNWPIINYTPLALKRFTLS